MGFFFRTPFADLAARARAGRFGLALFLMSLAVLFAATVAGYVVIRVQLERRGAWPDDLPALPRGLALSTLILLASSGTMHVATLGARAGRAASVRVGLASTTALGLAFLAVQVMCWLSWLDVSSPRWEESEGWRFALSGFYVMSGLHALHVLGGLIVLVLTTARSLGPDGTARAQGVERCATYWHFLDVVWLVLYGVLLTWT